MFAGRFSISIITACPLMTRELRHEWVTSHACNKARFYIWHPWELLLEGVTMDVPW